LPEADGRGILVPRGQEFPCRLERDIRYPLTWTRGEATQTPPVGDVPDLDHRFHLILLNRGEHPGVRTEGDEIDRLVLGVVVNASDVAGAEVPECLRRRSAGSQPLAVGAEGQGNHSRVTDRIAATRLTGRGVPEQRPASLAQPDDRQGPAVRTQGETALPADACQFGLGQWFVRRGVPAPDSLLFIFLTSVVN